MLELKLSLIQFRSNYTRNIQRTEPLIEELAEVTSLDKEGKVSDMRRAKQMIAQDYCRICIRKIVLQEPEALHVISRLNMLCQSGTSPRNIDQKVAYGEKSQLYLALAQRLQGSADEAVRTATPFFLAACTPSTDSDHDTSIGGLFGLVSSLLAVGWNDGVLAFVGYLHREGRWVCRACRSYVLREVCAAVCEYCFQGFCGSCVPLLREPEKTIYCVPGHRILWAPEQDAVGDGCVMFRGGSMGDSEVVEMVQREWMERGV